jgi:hypothetical protein
MAVLHFDEIFLIFVTYSNVSLRAGVMIGQSDKTVYPSVAAVIDTYLRVNKYFFFNSNTICETA